MSGTVQQPDETDHFSRLLRQLVALHQQFLPALFGQCFCIHELQGFGLAGQRRPGFPVLWPANTIWRLITIRAKT
ncbi:hypothetical protein VU06_03750, partial [Desulfobulbus sp. F3]|nr:hypothetical protein [Desulfobulbus sp. F3]